MGGAVSAGVNNDDLIDNLLEADYINSLDVERVFRAVDRGHYFTPEYKERAYRDLAWRCGNLHISAPCIYSRVMENLKLGPGMSFLNLGSGTGYLSTMAGLLLGSYGINHGVEIHEDVLNYSMTKLDEFILTSAAIDEYEFCEPKFINGNCLYLGSCERQYDRVYCGAACPENHESYMKNLIKVGGILVMPINDQLLQICRTSDTNWESKAVLPVSFATLISGKITDRAEPLKMPEEDPLSLQDICRFAVRSILRKIIDIEHPELKRPTLLWKRMKEKNNQDLIIPIFNGNSDGEEEQGDSHNHSIDDDNEEFSMDVSNIQMCTSITDWNEILQGTSAQLLDAIEARCAAIERNNRILPMEAQERVDEDEAMEYDSSCMILDHNEPSRNTRNVLDETMSDDDDFLSDVEFQDELQKSENVNESDGVKKSKSMKVEADYLSEQTKFKNKSKREKIDSGVVEDFDIGQSSSLDWEKSHCNGIDECNHISGDSEDGVGLCLKSDACTFSGNSSPLNQSTENERVGDSCDIHLKRKENQNNGSGSTKTNFTNTHVKATTPPHLAENLFSMPVINYTTYMKQKIKLLPLPLTLKYFLNLNREL